MTDKTLSDMDERRAVVMVDTFEFKLFCVLNVSDVTSYGDNVDLIEKRNEFYTFISKSVSEVIQFHKGLILRFLGDDLLFCFPNTVDPLNAETLNEAQECCFKIIFSRKINTKFSKDLLNVSYKVGADYGNFPIYKGKNFISFDLLGPRVTSLSMTKLAPANRVIITVIYMNSSKNFLLMSLSTISKKCKNRVHPKKNPPVSSIYYLQKGRHMTINRR